jgi:arsenate reductase
MVEGSTRKRVLILCTGNSCRSQMAEGWINHLLGERWEASSAGTRPAAAVHPLAVRVMREVGVDISAAVPRSVATLVDQPWDLVVTVCDDARESCPVFPRPVEQVHAGFPDPARAEGDDEQRLAVFRAIRDAIRERLLPELQRRANAPPPKQERRER